VPQRVWYGMVYLLIRGASGHCVAQWHREGYFVYLELHSQAGYFVYSGLHYESDLWWGGLASLDNTWSNPL
jgi:hypothetical protein